MNVPASWRSKAQRGVTLSSSEAEYVTISEALKEIKFINYLMREIRIEVNLPITVKTNNVGAMFMAQNASSGIITRYTLSLRQREFGRRNYQHRICQINWERFRYFHEERCQPRNLQQTRDEILRSTR
jgi:hypothetical protein